MNRAGRESRPLAGRHVCIVVNADYFFLSHRLPIALGALELGARVTVIAGDSGAGPEIESRGLDFVPLPIDRPGMSPLREGRTLRFLLRAYRRLRPDLVHHVTLKPIVHGTLAARAAGVPAVVNAVSGLGYAFADDGRARLMRLVLRPLLRLAVSSPAATLIVQNRDDLDFFVSRGWVSDAHVTLIRGAGVDVERFRPAPEPPAEPPLVVLPSRMLWDKGVGEFVEAARILRRDGWAGARLALVGEPDEGNRSSVPRDRLEAWAAEGVVEWWGHRGDMPRVLSSAHIVALPSYREGLPKVLLEAAASGRAIVASDVAGCRELVSHDRTGLLVPPRDAAALARAVADLLGDAVRRRRLGEAARAAAVESFEVGRVVRSTMALYRRVLDRHGS